MPAELPPLVMPLVIGVCLVIGLGSAALGWRAVQKPLKGIDHPGYMVYQQGLVIKVGSAIDVLRWPDVKELLSPAAANGKFRLVAVSGKSFDITRDVEDSGRFIQSLIQCVAAEKFPAAMEVLSNGEAVMFGTLGVRKDGLSYKDKSIDWSEVSSLTVAIGGGTLTIRKSGALLPWCSVDPNLLPNNELLGQLLIRVTPPHLLKEKVK